MRSIFLAMILVVLAGAAFAQSEPVALTGVHIVHVEDGRIERSRTVIVRDGRIQAIQPEANALAAGPMRRVDARGQYLIPGLWDMHVHAHRAGRERWHYPMYIAHGVVGVRDASTHLGSGMDFRAQGAPAGPAPRVIWGSPALDGAPPALSHGLAVETPEAGRKLVRLLAGLGYDFIKVYDGLSPENYHAIAEEAKRAGIPLEGHVPLTLSPIDIARAGQRTIEHLTLVLEACIPGTLDWVKLDPAADSIGLLADGRLAATLDRFDAAACQAQSRVLADAGVWQVPTLVQARSYFVVAHDDPADEPRLAFVPPDTRAEWFAHVREGKPAERLAGARVFARQHQLVGELHRAGVGILAGTDASDEVWVFPGSGLHDELALLAEAGLSPLDVLRTATLNPARYRARGRPVAPLIAPGSDADLVLLRENPLDDIRHTRDIRGVVAAGRWYSPEEIAAMVDGVRKAWPPEGGPAAQDAP
jgi:imidazolonepropionase-like amidohydrolase